MEESGSTPKVKLHFCHGKIFVWNHNDAVIIREKFGIIGSCFGCFPAKPRQNAQLSLPLLLSNIEAKFLLEYQETRLLNSSKFAEEVELEKYQRQLNKRRKLQYELQTQIKQNQKWKDLDEIAGTIKRGKLRKNAIKGVSEETGKSRSFPENEDFQFVCSDDEKFTHSDFEEFKKKELKKVERLGSDQTWVCMPVESELNISYPVLKASDISLTNEEKLKYAVFCDLHKQGFLLTDGFKFGGHFLVYPGDPGIYHSLFIVYCVDFKKKLSVTDYAALGRLATSVKKSLLLCSVDDNGFVVYSSLAWSGLV